MVMSTPNTVSENSLDLENYRKRNSEEHILLEYLWPRLW